MASSEELFKKFQKSVSTGEDDESLGRSNSNEDVDAEFDEDSSDEIEVGDPNKPENIEKRKRKRRIARLRRKSIAVRAYEFTGNSDVAGVIFLEVVKVTDLPPERNSEHCHALQLVGPLALT